MSKPRNVQCIAAYRIGHHTNHITEHKIALNISSHEAQSIWDDGHVSVSGQICPWGAIAFNRRIKLYTTNRKLIYTPTRRHEYITHVCIHACRHRVLPSRLSRSVPGPTHSDILEHTYINACIHARLQASRSSFPALSQRSLNPRIHTHLDKHTSTHVHMHTFRHRILPSWLSRSVPCWAPQPRDSRSALLVCRRCRSALYVCVCYALCVCRKRERESVCVYTCMHMYMRACIHEFTHS